MNITKDSRVKQLIRAEQEQTFQEQTFQEQTFQEQKLQEQTLQKQTKKKAMFRPTVLNLTSIHSKLISKHLTRAM